MENNPLISVIIPCYNQAQFLEETLNSVVSQTYQNWECIIINDGSTDDTAKVIQDYLSKDSRFFSISKENGGLSSARNAGLSIIKGDFVQFLDADDILHPDKFNIQIQYFLKDQDLDICYSNFNYFSENGITIKNHYSRIQIHDDSFHDFAFNWGFEFVIPIHCPLFKRNIITSNNVRFQEDLKAREDWLFWLNLCKKGNIHFQFVDKHLALYRKHHKSMVFDPVHMLQNTYKASLKVYELIPEHLKNEFAQKYAVYMTKQLETNLKLMSSIKDSWPHKINACLHKLKKRLKWFAGFVIHI